VPVQNSAPVHLLWTSGWDSTFRLLQLLHDTSAVIQPWYVLDESRGSTGTELRAMRTIRDAIREHEPAWAERILPTQFRALSEIPRDPEKAAMYHRLKRRMRLGTQYNWLSCLATHEGLDGLELGVWGPVGGIETNLERIETPQGTTVRLAKELDDPNVELFRPFGFPLQGWTKVGMQRRAVEAGFAHILEMTWFCFRPRRGRPCGRCRPCQVALKEGMGRRMPRLSRVLGRLRLMRRSVAAIFRS
jgi:hypothetical protein